MLNKPEKYISQAYLAIKKQLERDPNSPVVINWSMCEQLIEVHNVHNRPLRQAKVDEYGTDMEEKRWAVNGETLKFNVEGGIEDGQHRLYACWEHKTSFETYVVLGVPVGSFETIDIGIKRSPADSLAVAGNSAHANMAAPAIRVIMSYERKAQGLAAKRGSISNTEVIEFWRKNQKGLDDVCAYVSKTSALLKKLVPSSALVTLVYLAGKAGHDPEKVIHPFFFKLDTGEEIKSTDPIKKLRDKLITRQSQKSKADVYEVLIWCIRAFNATVQGRSLASIYGSQSSARGDSYPQVIKAKKR